MVKCWYLVSVLLNFEKKVVEVICQVVVEKGFEEQIDEVLVFIEEVIEICCGKKVMFEWWFMFGYVLVCMELLDWIYYLVNLINWVIGFFGVQGKLMLMCDDEVNVILNCLGEGGVEVVLCNLIWFDVGEKVNVIDGFFEGFLGMVEEVDEVFNCIKVIVLIFGWFMLVELEFMQVFKIV